VVSCCERKNSFFSKEFIILTESGDGLTIEIATGPQGPQTESGDGLIIEIPTGPQGPQRLQVLASREEVSAAVAALEAKILQSVEGLASREEVAHAVAALEAKILRSVEGLASREEVAHAVAALEAKILRSVEGLASREEVAAAVAALEAKTLRRVTTAETWSFTGTLPTGEAGEAWGSRVSIGEAETQKLLGFASHAKSGEATAEILIDGATPLTTLLVKAEEGYTSLGTPRTRLGGERLLLKVLTSTAKTVAIDAIVERT
jgi:hypothetical protein